MFFFARRVFAARERWISEGVDWSIFGQVLQADTVLALTAITAFINWEYSNFIDDKNVFPAGAFPQLKGDICPDCRIAISSQGKNIQTMETVSLVLEI